MRWQDGDVRPFELVSLSVERFRHAWLVPPDFALSSIESPVHSERCTPGSARGVRKPTRGNPEDKAPHAYSPAVAGRRSILGDII